MTNPSHSGQRAASPGARHLGADPRSLRGLLLRHPAWTLAGILLVAFNLRPALTSVSPFLGDIRQDLGLSGLAISLLSTAPVLCLGLFAPAAPPLARRFGIEAVLLAALLGIAAGIVVRSFGTIPFYLGTLLVGASMSLLGVLSPVLVKRDFPGRAGPVMGLYTMLISLGAALSTATAAPLRQAFGGNWHTALLFWAVPTVLAALVFMPQLFRHQQVHGVASKRAGGLLRNALAWQVTGFLTLVASLAYAVFTWAPSMLQARGLDPVRSGFVVSLSYLAQMATGLLVPIVAGRLRDQRLLAAALVLLTATGLLGFVFAPAWSLTAFSLVLGLGQGGAFGLALSLIVLRSGDQNVAAQLSGLSQTVGYAAGALIGPLAVGLIHDRTGSWAAVAIFYAAICLAALVLGLGAGRKLTLLPEPARPG